MRPNDDVSPRSGKCAAIVQEGHAVWPIMCLVGR